VKKDVFEKACRAAGIHPVRKEAVKDRNVLIADGFSAVPHVAFRRFGVEQGEFTFGAYCTIWLIEKDDEIEVGVPLIFDAFHNPEISHDMRQRARINTAMKEAAGFLDRRKKVRADGIGR
jgi:hypothetical protein